MLNLKLLGDGKRVLGQGAQQERTMAAEGACRTTCREGRGTCGEPVDIQVVPGGRHTRDDLKLIIHLLREADRCVERAASRPTGLHARRG